jgi:alkanesulfonate monooxygenase SsuD/methylene tetrahydromethanopterin reductase-like flavin-dependent oxidoreductase (luciferase family)
MTRQLHFNAFIKPPGEYLGAWRHPETRADAGVDFDTVLSFARTAEPAKFDAVFFADLVGVLLESRDVLSRVSVVNDSFEPTTLLAALAAENDHIGLIATASTTYNEPYHLTRTFASLDHISRGRVGWNVVTSLNDGEALIFGLDAHVGHAERYARPRSSSTSSRAFGTALTTMLSGTTRNPVFTSIPRSCTPSPIAGHGCRSRVR